MECTVIFSPKELHLAIELIVQFSFGSSRFRSLHLYYVYTYIHIDSYIFVFIEITYLNCCRINSKSTQFYCEIKPIFTTEWIEYYHSARMRSRICLVQSAVKCISFISYFTHWNTILFYVVCVRAPPPLPLPSLSIAVYLFAFGMIIMMFENRRSYIFYSLQMLFLALCAKMKFLHCICNEYVSVACAFVCVYAHIFTIGISSFYYVFIFFSVHRCVKLSETL